MVGTEDVFVDASADAGESIEFPDVVAAFEDLGFTRVGRLRRATPGALWREAAAYPKAVRTDYVTHRAVPSVVMAAPDRSAFATVTWWWGMPDVRIRSAMSDGSVVETVRAWDQVPVPPRGLGRLYRDGDLGEEQRLMNASAGGRSVGVVHGAPAELWAAHSARVSETAALGAVPGRHDDLAGALVLSNRLAGHQARCHRIQVRHGLLVLAAILVPGAAAIAAALLLPPTGKLVLLVLTLVALVVIVAFRRQIRAQSLRRRYDARRRPSLEGWTPHGPAAG